VARESLIYRIPFGNFRLKTTGLVSGSAFFLVFLLVTSLPSRADIEPSHRGRQLFFQGEIFSGESLTANVGAASIPVPATALPCVGCHGRDGKGRAEGGVRPSNITWLNLTKEYGGTTEMGRRYQAYDESRFLTAVTEGIDSSGNKLDSSMPRYNIARQDARDLIAYLRVIQDDFDPGVSKDEIVFGTLQPDKQFQTSAANAMIAVVQARLDEANRQGGIYGRQLKLEVTPYEDRQNFIAQASNLINQDKVFALVNVFSAGADGSLIDIVENAEIPSIAPYTQFPSADDGRHLYTFYLHGGLDSQIAVLARRAAIKISGTGKAFVLYQQDGGFENSAKKALAFLAENEIVEPKLLAYDRGSPNKLADIIDLKTNPNPAIIFIGSSSDLIALLSEQPNQQLPYLYLPGFFVSSQILQLPEAYAQRLEMTYATVPEGKDGQELSKFRQFMRRNKLDHDFLTARLFAYSATETLIEGVKRAGTRITRKNFVDAIEEIYGFDVGLNQPISYGSQRRTGLLGAHVVTLDTDKKGLIPTGTWVRLD